MEAIIDAMLKNPLITLIGAITIIQIAPLRLDPWGWIGRQLREALVGPLEKEVRSLQKDVIDEKVNNKRWFILNFANSCRQERTHTKEEWEHCLGELAWYEDYCHKHCIPNGVMTESGKYLRDLYQKQLCGDCFLK